MKKSWVLVLMLAFVLSITVMGCGGNQQQAAQETDWETKYQELKANPDDLAKAIQEEGAIVSYGMPDTWANLGEIWETFSTQYSIKHTDTDMSSAEELAKFQAEKDKPVADVGDVGITFGPKGVEMGVLAPHKNPYWDQIPDWAKDPDGYWCAEYTGTITFLVNTKKVQNVPRTWEDLLKPEYKGKVSIDDPSRSAQAQAGVLAAAMAHGGDETNIQPGIDFWKKLVKAGNYRALECNTSNIQKGEVVIAVIWDFNALNWKKTLEMPELEVVVPQDGSVTSAYVAIINKYAPHPLAARALNDYLFSDDAQIMYARGFARPIRQVQLPADVAGQLLPNSAYANAHPIKDFKAWEETGKLIPDLWESEVLAQ